MTGLTSYNSERPTQNGHDSFCAFGKFDNQYDFRVDSRGALSVRDVFGVRGEPDVTERPRECYSSFLPGDISSSALVTVNELDLNRLQILTVVV